MQFFEQGKWCIVFGLFNIAFMTCALLCLAAFANEVVGHNAQQPVNKTVTVVKAVNFIQAAGDGFCNQVFSSDYFIYHPIAKTLLC